jgi:hypothetical protein
LIFTFDINFWRISQNVHLYLEDILEFRKEVVNTKSWKGYFISNTDFEKSAYDQIEIFKDQVRLFNHSESLRLGLRSI